MDDVLGEADEMKEFQEFLDSFKPGLRKSMVMRTHIEDFRIKNEKYIRKVQERYNLDDGMSFEFKLALQEKKVNGLRKKYYSKINNVKCLQKDIWELENDPGSANYIQEESREFQHSMSGANANNQSGFSRNTNLTYL